MYNKWTITLWATTLLHRIQSVKIVSTYKQIHNKQIPIKYFCLFSLIKRWWETVLYQAVIVYAEKVHCYKDVKCSCPKVEHSLKIGKEVCDCFH